MLQTLILIFRSLKTSPRQNPTIQSVGSRSPQRTDSARTKPFTAPSRGPRPFGFKSVQMAVSSAWTPMAPAT